MSQFSIPDSLKKSSNGDQKPEEKKGLFSGAPPSFGTSSFGGFKTTSDARNQLMNTIGSAPGGSNPFRSGFLLKGQSQKQEGAMSQPNPFADRQTSSTQNPVAKPAFASNSFSSFSSRPTEKAQEKPKEPSFGTSRQPPANPFASRLFTAATAAAMDRSPSKEPPARETRIKFQDEPPIQDFDAPKRHREDREAMSVAQRIRSQVAQEDMKPLGRKRIDSKAVAASSLLAKAKTKSILKQTGGLERTLKRRTSDELKRPKRAVPPASAPFTYHTIPSKRTLYQQLHGLLNTHCPTAFDKYILLKKRDELLSKARAKTTDVERARIVHGTCPDMCPEKERYVREVQKNLNPYECDEHGYMIPEKTVKDYSRSAADQELPLPHELRPAHVLAETLNYLIGVIAREEPPNSDITRWYDFLWSRTRSIRKDITQQNMVNEIAVDLVEKCARLHVFVGFRLSVLDAGDFDQKMNTENMTKCLQSLRHLYDDLSKKRIDCQNEAEFRAYDIMLNLADTNVLSQVLTYRKAVRRSKPIQLALNLASALQNNNYVKFFRILKSDETTFLQACLCYRYFDQVRINALMAMVAFRKFPLDELSELLAFDEDTDALKFANCLGMELDYENPTDLNFAGRKEGNIDVSGITPLSKWIAAKQKGSLADVLCNGPCPPVNLPPPVDSFTPEGVYENDPVLHAYLTQNQDEDEALEEPMRKTVPVSPPRRDYPAFAAAFTTSAFISVYQDGIDRGIKTSGSKVYAEETTKAIADDIINEKIEIQTSEALFKARLEHKQHLVELERQIFKESINRYIVEESENVLKQVSEKMTRKAAERAIRHARNAHYQSLSEKVAKAQAREIIDQITRKCLTGIAVKVMQHDVIEVKERLDEICENLYRLWLKQFADRWREVVYRKKIKEERMKDIITTLSLANCSPQNRFYDPSKPFRPRKPPIRLSEEELELKFAQIKLKNSKRQRLARRVFDIWHRATKKKVEQRKFLQGFFNATSISPSKNESIGYGLKRKRSYLVPFKAPPVFGVAQQEDRFTPRQMFGVESIPMASISAKRPRLVAMLANRKKRSYLNSTEMDIKKEVDENQGTPMKHGFFGSYKFSYGDAPSPIPRRLSLPDKFAIPNMPESPTKRHSLSPKQQEQVFKTSVTSLEKKLEAFRLALKETQSMIDKDTQKCQDALNITA